MSKPTDKPKGRAWTLWAGVILAFALLIGAWTTIIMVARAHPTESVPLETVPDDPEPSQE